MPAMGEAADIDMDNRDWSEREMWMDKLMKTLKSGGERAEARRVESEGNIHDYEHRQYRLLQYFHPCAPSANQNNERKEEKTTCGVAEGLICAGAWKFLDLIFVPRQRAFSDLTPSWGKFLSVRPL